ncbi:uncharacterized protein LOC131292847 [Anopheles ziemanni]|uniref:uncharacterized protein LOC131271196 n=1 Tax=Anopheles coustani TaxID=139045 RepID=UPI0026588F10|nr:uncharacterized protein LOC131271196 [Anopheles coustani]XP_058176924.1 uncharacterized protein LOC131292847 [Anopheles ziemanni]
MKNLAFVVVVIVAVVQVEAFTGLGPVKSKHNILEKCEENTERQRCKDCLTVDICSYDNFRLAQYRCKDVNPLKPYCTGKGECTDKLPAGDDCTGKDDLCPEEAGYYPDPTNCTRYLICDSNQKAYAQTCAVANNVYQQETASCILKRRSSDCFQVDCKAAKNLEKWFQYTPSPQFYFLCSAAGPFMSKCPENEIFDVNTKQCEFQCSSVGRFPYPGEEKKYYECVETSTSKIQKFEQTCPGTMIFKYDDEKPPNMAQSKKGDHNGYGEVIEWLFDLGVLS